MKSKEELLQEKYDSVCSQLVWCGKNKCEVGWNEYLCRKDEIEEISKKLDIKLLKYRSIERIYELVARNE